MSVYVIEEHSDYYAGEYHHERIRFDYGYFSKEIDAHEFAEQIDQSKFEEWAKNIKRLRARDEENYYYPELWDKEEMLLRRIFGSPQPDFSQEPDTSRQAYQNSYDFTTFSVRKILTHQ